MNWETPIQDNETKEKSIFEKREEGVENFLDQGVQEIDGIVEGLSPEDKELFRKAVGQKLMPGFFESGF